MLAAFSLASCSSTESVRPVEKSGRKKPAGYTVQEYSYTRCGDTGFTTLKRRVVVLVVGGSGGLNCVVTFYQKHIDASDFEAGYICVSPSTAKPAAIVRESDPRVLAERSYPAVLESGKQYAREHGLPLKVVYVTTRLGPPHPEPRCARMLDA